MLQVHTPKAPGGAHPSVPPSVVFPVSTEGRRPYKTGISRLISFHWRCGLQSSCLRFTNVVPRVIRMASIRVLPTSFLLVSQVLQIAQDSVPNGWLALIRVPFAGHLILRASRRAYCSGSSGRQEGLVRARAPARVRAEHRSGLLLERGIVGKRWGVTSPPQSNNYGATA